MQTYINLEEANKSSANCQEIRKELILYINDQMLTLINYPRVTNSEKFCFNSTKLPQGEKADEYSFWLKYLLVTSAQCCERNYEYK